MIVADMDVANFGGMSVLATAKRECPRTPLIFVTGNYREGSRNGVLKGGASGYLDKADAAALTQIINELLTDRRSEGNALDHRKRETVGSDTSGIAATQRQYRGRVPVLRLALAPTRLALKTAFAAN